MSGMMMMVMMMPTALIGFCVNWAVRLSIDGRQAGGLSGIGCRTGQEIDPMCGKWIDQTEETSLSC